MGGRIQGRGQGAGSSANSVADSSAAAQSVAIRRQRSHELTACTAQSAAEATADMAGRRRAGLQSFGDARVGGGVDHRVILSEHPALHMGDYRKLKVWQRARAF